MGPKNKDCIVTPLFAFLNKFSSNSFRIDISSEFSSKISDKCAWEIAWSSIIDINGISGLKDVDSWVSDCGD